MNQEETEEFMLESVEALMSMLQVLVIALGKDGRLDTEEYARLLLDLRERTEVESGSYQDVLIQRMLSILVADDPEVLVRRWGIRAVQTDAEPPP